MAAARGWRGRSLRAGFRSRRDALGAHAKGCRAFAAPAWARVCRRVVRPCRMVAARKSNKELGGELQISSRTVSTHLSNIFVKLNVSSRGELADFVRQKGLLEA